MPERRPLFPERFLILSGSALKLIALLAMLIDHTGIALRIPLERILLLPSRGITAYTLFRGIGRIAFPIFCFLLTEGFRHTRDKLRYALRLLVFALVSEPLFDLFRTLRPIAEGQNVFFTLLLGFLGLWAAERYRERPWIQLPLLLGLFAAAWLLDTDYSWKGFSLILLLYYLSPYPVVQAMGGSLLLPWPAACALAFLPIGLYDGQRGFIRGRWTKYLFYAFYPAHLALLWLLRLRLARG